MRVLYVEPLGIDGGMGHYNDVLVASYAQLGHSVEVITTSPSHRLKRLARVTTSRSFTYALDRRRSRQTRAGAYFAALAGACMKAVIGRVDVVVFHLLHAPIVDFLILAVLRAARKRVVIIAHDPVPVLRHQRIGHSSALRMASLVVVHGQAARADIIEAGVEQRRILVAPFGDYLAAEPLEEALAKEALGVVSELKRPVALIVGNLKQGKGIQRTVAALSATSSPIACLLVVGTQQGDWDLNAALRLPLGSPLQLIRVDTRMSDREELAAYSLADVVLVLYESGYSSAVIARAHAVGRRVVTTNVGDLAAQADATDAVIDRGYDDDSLRRAIEQCLRNSSRPPRLRLDEWTVHAKSVIDRLKST